VSRIKSPLLLLQKGTGLTRPKEVLRLKSVIEFFDKDIPLMNYTIPVTSAGFETVDLGVFLNSQYWVLFSKG
jgi:hypothetical protein